MKNEPEFDQASVNYHIIRNIRAKKDVKPNRDAARKVDSLGDSIFNK